MHRRYENPAAVQIDIDANGWPQVIVWPADDGKPEILRLHPRGNAEILVDASSTTYPKDPLEGAAQDR